MIVIALEGKKNVGKTQTLKKVCDLLLHKDFVEIKDSFKDLGNEDFTIILEGFDKKIGILTQGDYMNTINLLNDLERKECDICLCACSLDKKGLKEKIDETYHPKFIYKKRNDLNSQTIENINTALRLKAYIIDICRNNTFTFTEV